ncbi:MAG: ribosomal protein L7/L12, partial [Bacteroidales bacterium]|nr:ribosomal protein L7/L12 [Bacteroidales bacterium]
LTDACTEIDVSNAEYAQLRVKGSASSSTYDLYLNAYDVENHKLDVIRGVRELTGLGLKEAKELVDSAPVKVMGFATRAAAEAAKATLEAIAGTQCSIKELKAAGSFVKVLRDGEDVTTDMTPDGDYLMMSIDAADLTRTTWVITTEEIINRFDTNDDGTVDISDVTKLVNKVLGKE